LFDKLDRDHDGTLDKRELASRLSAKEFAAADPDHDGTLTKDEYLAVVEQRFKAANQDSDGTLDAKEFGTKAGQSLMRLFALKSPRFPLVVNITYNQAARANVASAHAWRSRNVR
jgi:hypothetical protein